VLCGVVVLQVSDYWRMVIEINDYQKSRYVERVIKSMFNTVSKKKIAVSATPYVDLFHKAASRVPSSWVPTPTTQLFWNVHLLDLFFGITKTAPNCVLTRHCWVYLFAQVLGFAFKKDTGDTRETPAIDVCRGLLADGADLHIYDPKVGSRQQYAARVFGLAFCDAGGITRAWPCL
jgi:hypothetical protein